MTQRPLGSHFGFIPPIVCSLSAPFFKSQEWVTHQLALQLVLWLEFVKLELNRLSPKRKVVWGVCELVWWYGLGGGFRGFGVLWFFALICPCGYFAAAKVCSQQLTIESCSQGSDPD